MAPGASRPSLATPSGLLVSFVLQFWKLSDPLAARSRGADDVRR